MQDLN